MAFLVCRIPTKIIWLALAGLISFSARAEHVDPAPLPRDVVQKVIVRQKLSKGSLAATALNRHLDELADITRPPAQRLGRKLTDAETISTSESQRSLVASKRQELMLTRNQVREELAQTRKRLSDLHLNNKVKTWDDFARKVDRRFQRLDSAIAAVDVADRSKRRTALDQLAAEIKTLRGDPAAVDTPSNSAPVPTLRMDVPQHTSYPATPSVRLPAYIARRNSSTDSLFVSLTPPPPTPPEAASCGYTSADLAATPDAPTQSSDIQTLAAQLNYSPAKIFQYVSNTIKFEPYYGSLKGALATLYAKAGGPTDQASLLIALLRASNIPARYVRGTIQVFDRTPDPNGGRVARWVGAKSYYGAMAILNEGSFQGNSQGYSVLKYDNGLQFNQVWVEACIPYGRYRGAALDNSGERWIPLDPSFKDQSYQAGITTNVSFDYTGYLASRKNGPDSLPHEAYAQQVEAAIRTSNPNSTLADVPFQGTINPLALDILPASLPYEVVNFLNWSGTTSPEIAQLPAAHRYRFSVNVNSAGASSLYLPDVALSRITLSFTGATASDMTALNSWYGDLSVTSSPPCTINVVPALLVEGQPKSIAGTSVGLCSTGLTLGLAVYLDELYGNPINTVTYSNIAAANWHALQAYAFQASDTLLAKRAQSLINAAEQTTPQKVGTSVNGIDQTEGEFLHLVGLKFMRYITDALKTIGGLNGQSGQSGNHIGLASSQAKIQYLFDLPFAVSRSGYLIDVPGGVSRSVDLNTGSTDWNTFLLGAYSASAYESYIWQENAELDAVSTVRGLQFANETGVGVISINSSNWASQRSQLAVYVKPGSQVSDCTPSAALQYTQCDIDDPNRASSLVARVNLGYTVTLPKTPIQYGDWKGLVRVDQRSTPNGADSTCSSMCVGMLISKYAGGYTTGTQISDTTYNSSLNTGTVAPSQVPTANVTNSATTGNSPVNSTTATNGLSAWITTAGDPVNMVTGNMYHSERDIAIKGRGGFPIVFERFYNSRNPVDGALGFGWTHSFNHSLKFYGVENGVAKVSWTDGTGAEKFFATSNHSNGNVTVNSTIPAPAGVFVTFQRLSNGTYSIREKNGLTYVFENATGPSGVPGSGTTPVIARLLSITDRNGNALSLSYNSSCGNNLCSVTDGLSRALTFSYSGNHLSQIQDFSGRQFQYFYDAAGNLQSFKNPLAISGVQSPVIYRYYSTIDGFSFNHLMRQYSLPRGNGMEFEYYANGRTFRHTVVHPDGTLSSNEVNTFTYNDFRRETIQTSERGYQRHFFFDANGNPLKIVEENGAEHSYTYDCADPSQSAGSSGCPNPFNRLSKSDPTGYATHYAYDSNGNVIQITSPRGATAQFLDFNSFNQPRRVVDANGHWTILRYDARGNVTDEIHAASGYTPPACVSSECVIPAANQMVSWSVMGYDSVGNLTSIKHVRDFAAQLASNTPTSNTGPIATFAYDTSQLNATTIARIGIQNNNTSATTVNSATLGYDGLGRLSSGVDGDWYPTQTVYDSLDRVTQATDSLGNLRSYFYDANGNPGGQELELSVNNASTLIDSSSVQYDGSDRRLTSMDAGGFVTTYAYDASGNVVSVTNPDNYSLTFEYDAGNRVARAYDQQGHAVTTTRDTDGKVRTVTDPNGNTVSYTYWDGSRDGRLKSLTNPQISNNGAAPAPMLTSGRSVQYDYDAAGNATSVTEIPAAGSGQANRTSMTSFDELNRPVRIVGPQYTDVNLGSVCPVTINKYDTLGRLYQVAAGSTPSPCTNAASDSTTVQMTYAFDDFGKLITQTDALNRSWTFFYDSHNNLQTATDAKSQVTQFTWLRGKQLQTRIEQGGRTTTYSRNALGQVTQVSHPIATYGYGYDTAHRLTSVTDYRGYKTLNYSYSAGGLLNSITDSESRMTNYFYDPVGRLSGITGPNGDTVNVRFDAGGRLVERLLPNGISSRYQYNEDNSLKQVVNNNTATTILTQHDYSYDGVGNRLLQTENIGGSVLNYAYSYDELKRLTQVTNGTPSQQENYSYDVLSNRILKSLGQTSPAITAYKYDAANELTEIHNGSLTGALIASVTYDNNGNISNDGGRAYTWDSLNQLAQVVQGATTVGYQYDSDGRRVLKTTGGATTQWTYSGQDIYAEYGSSWTSPNALYTGGSDLPLIRATVSSGTYGQATYYYQDGLGSVVGLSNSTDSTTQTQRFDAWGSKLSGTVSQSAQYGYTGREPDETGLIYYRARYYSPSIGRFVSRDPIGLGGGVNQYAYVLNNPTGYDDPNGLLAKAAWSATTTYFGEATDKLANGSINPTNDPLVKMVGTALAADTAYIVALATGDQSLQDTALKGMQEAVTPEQGVQFAASMILGGRVGEGGALEGGSWEGAPQFVYRNGSGTADNLTPRPGLDTTGVSVFDTMDAATPPGGKAQVIDTTKLNLLSAVPDSPAGHLSITPSEVAQVTEWAASRGTGQIHPLTQELLNAIVGVVKRPK